MTAELKDAMGRLGETARRAARGEDVIDEAEEAMRLVEEVDGPLDEDDMRAIRVCLENYNITILNSHGFSN